MVQRSSLGGCRQWLLKSDCGGAGATHSKRRGSGKARAGSGTVDAAALNRGGRSRMQEGLRASWGRSGLKGTGERGADTAPTRQTRGEDGFRSQQSREQGPAVWCEEGLLSSTEATEDGLGCGKGCGCQAPPGGRRSPLQQIPGSSSGGCCWSHLPVCPHGTGSPVCGVGPSLAEAL